MFTYSENWAEQDNREKVTREKRTEEEIRNLMNSINSDLSFTTETERDFQKVRLPTLSFELWSTKVGIQH